MTERGGQGGLEKLPNLRDVIFEQPLCHATRCQKIVCKPPQFEFVAIGGRFHKHVLCAVQNHFTLYAQLLRSLLRQKSMDEAQLENLYQL